MKTYIAIGHFKESENITSVAMKCTSRKSFEQNLRGNEFVAWAVIGERKMEALKRNIDDCFGLWEEVKKLTSNYRKWNELIEYIEQCIDIMEEKIKRA